MNNNENNKQVVKHQIDQVTFLDLIHFKEDFLKTLHELENTMIKNTTTKLDEFNSDLKEVSNKTEILEKLHELDNSLCRDTEIILCGSASMLLQDYNFRGTSDIDFCRSCF